MDHLIDILMNLTGPVPYLLVFLVLLACGLGVPIPEDITLFAAGLVSYYGNANVFVMIAVSFVGVMLGDGLMFFLGHRFGIKLLEKRFFKKIFSADRLAKVNAMILDHGTKIIFAARFMPGLRAPIYFSAGTLKVPYRIFLLCDGLAALLSVPAIVYLTFYFGHEVDEIIHVIRKAQNGIVLTILAIVAFYVLKAKIKKSV
jgi:membrane protein DedA with SNARE-associated domain